MVVVLYIDQSPHWLPSSWVADQQDHIKLQKFPSQRNPLWGKLITLQMCPSPLLVAHGVRDTPKEGKESFSTSLLLIKTRACFRGIGHDPAQMLVTFILSSSLQTGLLKMVSLIPFIFHSSM